MTLEGKVVVITGASRGLGAAMATGFAKAGAELVVTARQRSEERLRSVVEKIEHETPGARVRMAFGDVAREEDCRAIVRAAEDAFGAVHVLVNNAGLGMDLVGPLSASKRRFQDIPVDIWRRIVDANFNGVFLMSRAVVPAMLERHWGRIINVGTSYPTMTKAGFAPYGPSKAAVEALTVIMANELTETGVTANVLLPGGGSDTDMMPREDWPDRSKLIAPNVMVPPAVWLASEASDGISGMRIVARDWNASLPAEQAYRASSAKAGTSP